MLFDLALQLVPAMATSVTGTANLARTGPVEAVSLWTPMLLDGVQFGELSQGGGKSVLVEFNVVNFGQHHSLQSFLMDFLFEMVLNPFLVPGFNEVYAHVEYERTLRRYRVYG